MHVDLRNWLRTLLGNPPEGYESGLRYFLGGAYNGVFFSVTSRYPLGTNVYDREWDLLVVLDACRVDALRTVAPEFDFLGDVGAIWSVGSSSHEWLCKTFTGDYREEVAGTAYLSSNPHTQPTFEGGKRPPRKYAVPVMWADWDVVDAREFALLRQLPRNRTFAEYFDTVLPEAVTDHAIVAGRELECDRLVAHYYQPHRPHIAAAYREERPVTDVENQPWEAVAGGEASRAEVWENYLDNLRLALESVGRLLENVDAERVAITADHGELFGEVGMYGHPEGVVHPSLKKVPWAVTTATDSRTSTPDVDLEGEREPTEAEVEEHLKTLGYLG